MSRHRRNDQFTMNRREDIRHDDDAAVLIARECGKYIFYLGTAADCCNDWLHRQG